MYCFLDIVRTGSPTLSHSCRLSNEMPSLDIIPSRSSPVPCLRRRKISYLLASSLPAFASRRLNASPEYIYKMGHCVALLRRPGSMWGRYLTRKETPRREHGLALAPLYAASYMSNILWLDYYVWKIAKGVQVFTSFQLANACTNCGVRQPASLHGDGRPSPWTRDHETKTLALQCKAKVDFQ